MRRKPTWRASLVMVGLQVSDVVHKAFIAVNEEGTEAAAAEAFTFRCNGIERPKEPVTFRANHPFLFIIYHRDVTRNIVFIGRLVDPR